jgi:hypothetical protein
LLALPDGDGARFGLISDRRARMITVPPPVEPTPPVSGRVLIDGTVDRDVMIALHAAGFQIVEDGADVCVVLGASLDKIAARVALATPVIADAAREDFSRISSLLRLGVDDVTSTPVVPAALVRVLTRVMRKRLERQLEPQ